MRFHVVALVALVNLVCAATISGHGGYASAVAPAYARKRGLGDIFGGFEPDAAEPTPAEQASANDIPTKTENDPFAELNPFETTSAASSSTKKDTASTTSIASTSSSSSPHSTPPPSTTVTQPTTSTAVPTPTHSTTPSSSSSSSTSTTWKIVGVAVIAVGAVAVVLFAAMSFDHWWGFVRDVVVGRWHSQEGVEEFVPDWEKASWEVRLSADRQRYPTFASLPDGLAQRRPAPTEGAMGNDTLPGTCAYGMQPALSPGDRAMSPGPFRPGVNRFHLPTAASDASPLSPRPRPPSGNPFSPSPCSPSANPSSHSPRSPTGNPSSPHPPRQTRTSVYLTSPHPDDAAGATMDAYDGIDETVL